MLRALVRRSRPFPSLAGHSVAAFAFALLLPAAAGAQGYFAGAKGARVAGRAGAFVAKADDLFAVELNPAGLSRMPGWTFQLSNRFSYNSVSYQRDPTTDTGQPGNPEVSFEPALNQRPLQGLDPLLGVAYGVGDWGFALSAYAPPGIARLSFPEDGGQRYMMVERDAEILTYTASVAYAFKELFGVGATAQWVHVPKLQYSLVVDGFPGAEINPVESQYDMLSTVSGSDPFTMTAVIGGWVKPLDFLEFGLSGQIIPAEIRATSTLGIEPLSPSFSDGYVELTRDGYPADNVTLVLPLPMIARFGARYLGKNFDVELDATYQTWSRVHEFVLYSDGLVGTLYDMVDGEPNEVDTIEVGNVVIEKRWQDSFTLQLGGDYRLIEDKLTLRGGFGYESAVAPAAYANVDFATGQHINLAIGGSLFLGQFEIALAYALRHQLPLYVSEADGQVFQEKPGSTAPPPVVNAGSYYATSHFLSLDALLRLQ
jgi:long-subunit fatty acid transport protein